MVGAGRNALDGGEMSIFKMYYQLVVEAGGRGRGYPGYPVPYSSGYSGGGGHLDYGGRGGTDGSNGGHGSNSWGYAGGAGSGVDVSTILVPQGKNSNVRTITQLNLYLCSPGTAGGAGTLGRLGLGGGGVIVNNDGPVTGNGNGKGYGCGSSDHGSNGNICIVILAFNYTNKFNSLIQHKRYHDQWKLF